MFYQVFQTSWLIVEHKMTKDKQSDNYLTNRNFLSSIRIRPQMYVGCSTMYENAGADPGFLERGFIYIYISVGVGFADFISFCLYIP